MSHADAKVWSGCTYTYPIVARNSVTVRRYSILLTSFGHGDVSDLLLRWNDLRSTEPKRRARVLHWDLGTPSSISTTFTWGLISFFSEAVFSMLSRNLPVGK